MQIQRLSLARRFDRRHKSRPAFDVEWMFRYCASHKELGVEFFVERVPVSIGIRLPAQNELQVREVHALVEGTWQSLDYVIETNRRADERAVLVHLQTQVRTGLVRVTLAEDLDADFWISVVVHKQMCRDLALLFGGLRWADSGEIGLAVQEFEKYFRIFSERNPVVNVHLARWHRKLGQMKRAEHHALLACAVGRLDACVPEYQAIIASWPGERIEDVRELQARAREWGVGGDPGVVVLDSRHDLMFDIADGVHAYRDYELMEIRRASAGRMLTRLQFGFQADLESVLFSSVRIIRADGEEESVPQDQMTVRDDHDANALITVRRDKVLSWLLPELRPGDLIETRFHRMCAGRRIGGRSWPGRIERIVRVRSPIFRSTCWISGPPDVDLRIVPMNGPAQVVPVAGARPRSRTSVRFDRIVPASRKRRDHEAVRYEPAVAVGPAHADWAELARHLRGTLLGGVSDEALPRSLAATLAGAPNPEQALESCFYLLRDELKYGATRNGKNRIGVSGRAEQIFGAGVADCSDKSYLLHLVCRELGLDHEFVLFDSAAGLMCEDVPIDNFDHVVLRVQLGARELWLDAADSFGCFSCVPLPLQGMQGLALDPAGTIVLVPENEPWDNRVMFRERLDHFEGNMLAGSFQIEAHGTSGRILDENLRAASLAGAGRDWGASVALRAYLPELRLHAAEVESSTANSRVFRVTGRHARGRVLATNDSGAEMASLMWLNPHLPYWDWPILDREQRTNLGMSMAMTIDVELGEAVKSALVERTTIDPCDNELYSTSESIADGDGHLDLHREFVLRRRVVEPPLSRLLPDLADAVASLSNIALRLDGRRQPRARAQNG